MKTAQTVNLSILEEMSFPGRGSLSLIRLPYKRPMRLNRDGRLRPHIFRVVSWKEFLVDLAKDRHGFRDGEIGSDASAAIAERQEPIFYIDDDWSLPFSRDEIPLVCPKIDGHDGESMGISAKLSWDHKPFTNLIGIERRSHRPNWG